MMNEPRFLMCLPRYFSVSYVINPWMQGHLQDASPQRATLQWQRLHATLNAHASVALLDAQPDLPDLTFTANAGLVWGQHAVVSRFRHPERQGEEPHFAAWFERNGFLLHQLPPHVPFEGAGDALFDRAQPVLWLGHGQRSSAEAQGYLARWLPDLEVVPLRLVDSRFYHLDTCFCPLHDGYLLYYPPAFDEAARRAIAARVPAEKRIVVEAADAVHFACNAVNIGRTLLLNRATPELQAQLAQADFALVQVDLSEFIKAGGAAKCLTLRLDEPT
ncbi:MAG: dimethylarginine dimethylaminohydrolase family protein [Chloroflexaceae bacterium]|nr:dimethylarginine dimethylaminohydrolase family protein [Chloroflexaceae bacterium]